jgi:aryl-alcohol dehydrogenase-like predicted oxidoreductase
MMFGGRTEDAEAVSIIDRTIEQLDDNPGAVDMQITDEDLAKLDEVSLPGHRVVSFYDADFGPHKYR